MEQVLSHNRPKMVEKLKNNDIHFKKGRKLQNLKP